MKFTGIWPALVTPLTNEGKIHVEATEKLVADLLATGIGGLYVCGGTGEGVLLSPAQRREMAELVIRLVAGRVPVMIHVGDITTETSVELAQHASLVGADAVSAIPPFYYSYPFPAILEHYRAIAAASAVPLYIYFIPGATGTAVTPQQLLEICALDGIAGLKYTSQDLHFLSTLMALRDPEQVTVFSGPDELFLPCLSLGVEGAIGTTYNFMPRLYIDIMQSFLHGEHETARQLYFAARRIILVLLRHSVIAATKALLTMLGYPVGFGVPPMPAMDGPDARALRAELEEAGLIELLQRPALYGPAGDPMRGKLA
jgi:N-acetylneuraminate lyase